MKNLVNPRHRIRTAFTLVELLVVIAIIGILAAILLPVIVSAVRTAKMKKALVEEQGIVTAIEGYDSAYGRFPVSSGTQAAASANANGDFTYGGTVLANASPPFPSIDTSNNSEVIAILMDITNYPNGSGPTANNGHVKNTQQRQFLNVHMTGDQTLPGVGPDLVYRDPWGNPYIISMDLNNDEVCEDALYKMPAVSSGSSLILQPDGNYAFHGKVMVWSAGPDKMIAPGSAASAGANKDNVVSW